MKALISGQAGLALLIDGDHVESIHFDSSRPVSRTKADIPYLLADVSDVIEVRDTTPEKAAAALDLSWRQDRALHLILILLDREAGDEARHISAECLDEFLSDPKVFEFIANRLFSAPLPSSADMMSALLLAESVVATKLNELLEDLRESQPEIRRRRAEWDALPAELFGGSQAKLEFGYVAVTNGTIRRLVQSQPHAINDLLVTALGAPQFQRFARSRQIIMSWIKPFATPLLPALVHGQKKTLIATTDRITSYALVTYIPDPMASFLDRLRQELVPNYFLRAHVTILPPRPITWSPREAWDGLCFEANRFEPFDVELTGVEVFPVSDVIHIAIGHGADQLRAMHAAMNAGGLKFTECFPYHPHITLAQNLKPDELGDLIGVARQRWNEYQHPRTFRVETLTFVQSTRRHDWIDLGEFRLGVEGTEAFVGGRIDDSSLRR